MIPKAEDHVMVFNFGKQLNNISFNLTSQKQFRMIKSINSNSHIGYNLYLRFSGNLETIAGSVERQVAFQGKTFELNQSLPLCESNETCPEIKVHWIPDQLSKFRDDSQNEPDECSIQNQLRITGQMYCLNFSSNSRMINYAYITEFPAKVEHMLVNHQLNKRNKMSWNYASSVCKYMGGFLPIIRSKSELDEFITLITFSQYIPPQDKIFISLSTSLYKV